VEALEIIELERVPQSEKPIGFSWARSRSPLLWQKGARVLINAHVLGTGAYAPKRVLTNQDLAELVDTTDAWIIGRTGISSAGSRRKAKSLRIWPLSRRATRWRWPGQRRGSRHDHRRHGLGRHAAAVLRGHHSSQAWRRAGFCLRCFGGLRGFSLCFEHRDQFIKTGKASRILVIGAELLSRLVDWSDRNTCVLFGDAAGAMVVGPALEPGRGLLSTHLHSDGTAAGILSIQRRQPASPIRTCWPGSWIRSR